MWAMLWVSLEAKVCKGLFGTAPSALDSRKTAPNLIFYPNTLAPHMGLTSNVRAQGISETKRKEELPLMGCGWFAIG
jgi:hypothetical protein